MVMKKESNLKAKVYSKMTIMEKMKLVHLLQNNRKKDNVYATHNKKILKLRLQQRPRSHDCILNLSNRKLSVEEKNVLYRGLNHNVLPKI